jgi:hypothetical protein
MLCKKIMVVKCKEVKSGCNLAESSTEGYGSKRVVLLMMLMMTTTTVTISLTLQSITQTWQESTTMALHDSNSFVHSLQRD